MVALTLTGPELSMLAGTGGLVSEACSLPSLDDAASVFALAALHTRQLVHIGAEEAAFVQEAAVLSSGLGMAETVAVISTVTEGQAGAVYLVATPRGDFAVAPLLLGCYQIDLLAAPIGDVCVGIVEQAASQPTEVLVAVEVRTGQGSRGLAVRSSAAGDWQLAVVGGGAPATSSAHEVASAVHSLFGPTEAGTSARPTASPSPHDGG